MATVRSQSVPFELKNSPLVDVFKNKLKTVLFNRTLWLISTYVCLLFCFSRKTFIALFLYLMFNTCKFESLLL